MDKIIILFTFIIYGVNAFALNVNIQDTGFDRITNGLLAAETQFPYAVSIQEEGQVQNSTFLHRCGGVLITFQHVLTAASCTYNIVNGSDTPILASAHRVFAGSAILSNETPDRIRPIANYTIHPEYVGAPSFLNDLAVITLSAPFPNTTVVPLALPTENFIPADFAVCTVAGWGGSSYANNASAELRYANKYIYNQELCTSLYNSVIGIANIFPSMICAASYDILAAGCTGDQGNALVCNGQLAGVLSLTNNCQATSYPEIYTRVSNYTTWIRSVTGGASSYRPKIVLLFLFTLVQIFTANIFS